MQSNNLYNIIKVLICYLIVGPRSLFLILSANQIVKWINQYLSDNRIDLYSFWNKNQNIVPAFSDDERVFADHPVLKKKVKGKTFVFANAAQLDHPTKGINPSEPFLNVKQWTLKGQELSKKMVERINMFYLNIAKDNNQELQKLLPDPNNVLTWGMDAEGGALKKLTKYCASTDCLSHERMVTELDKMIVDSKQIIKDIFGVNILQDCLPGLEEYRTEVIKRYKGKATNIYNSFGKIFKVQHLAGFKQSGKNIYSQKETIEERINKLSSENDYVIFAEGTAWGNNSIKDTSGELPIAVCGKSVKSSNVDIKYISKEIAENHSKIFNYQDGDNVYDKVGSVHLIQIDGLLIGHVHFRAELMNHDIAIKVFNTLFYEYKCDIVGGDTNLTFLKSEFKKPVSHLNELTNVYNISYADFAVPKERIAGCMPRNNQISKGIASDNAPIDSDGMIIMTLKKHHND